ncbi:YcgL domain-containing protein [Marinobacter bryozoorum]|uniref:YcgL domain-containing protein n=1 Tax=Marinobacter bryozoorum TaxID=256324 RepID=UPI0020059A77|nr:YcgL domain-containing protein [Marinobacter bryozoorum]MCK7544720.1 YcgL domain-containing protein [Marinobacter bryozoorum]
MTEKTFVSVFRSSKREGTYIYLRRGHDWNDLPESLRELFGTPVPALDLVLTPERRLARTTGKEVLEAISEKDYYLQLPEKADSYIVSFKEKLRGFGA